MNISFKEGKRQGKVLGNNEAGKRGRRGMEIDYIACKKNTIFGLVAGFMLL